jgi:hypothetical protein
MRVAFSTEVDLLILVVFLPAAALRMRAGCSAARSQVFTRAQAAASITE